MSYKRRRSLSDGAHPPQHGGGPSDSPFYVPQSSHRAVTASSVEGGSGGFRWTPNTQDPRFTFAQSLAPPAPSFAQFSNDSVYPSVRSQAFAAFQSPRAVVDGIELTGDPVTYAYQPPPLQQQPIASTSYLAAEPARDQGRRYSIEVVQHPLRARMCGFGACSLSRSSHDAGDRDRRPLTPPLIVKLVVRSSSGRAVHPEELDLGFYICSADLWDAEGQREANYVSQAGLLVESPSSTPRPLSASSLPSPAPQPAPSLLYQLPSPPTPYQSGYRRDSIISTSSTSAPVTPGVSGYFGPQYSAPPNSLLSAVLPHPEYGQQSSSFYDPKPIYSQPLPQPIATSQPLPTPPAPAAPVASTSTLGPSGSMCNLIGALQSTAFSLRDLNDEEGIFFVFPDLSVRTEGRYRLRLQCVSLGDDAIGIQPAVDVIASAFSDKFEVTSAKKFQGMVGALDDIRRRLTHTEPTALSQTFAAQGVKIPTRRTTKTRAGAGSDED